MTIQKNKKVGFFVGCDLIGLITLNKIIPLLDKMGILPVIYYTDTHLNRRFKVPPPKSVSFFNVGLLRDTILPTLEEYAPYEFHACSFRQLATRYGGTFVEIKDVNDPDFLESIRTDKELCGAISIRFLQVFEAPAIQTFEQKGFLWNLHGGILPQYKGLLLPFRAIANGEKESGLTLHKIREGIDTGDILEIGTKLLLPSKPIFETYLDLIPTGVAMMEHHLHEFFRHGDNIGQKQNTGSNKTYYSYPTTQEFNQYLAQGLIYADPVRTPSIISSLFLSHGTDRYSKLKQKISTQINEATEQAPSPRQKPPVYAPS